MDWTEWPGGAPPAKRLIDSIKAYGWRRGHRVAGTLAARTRLLWGLLLAPVVGASLAWDTGSNVLSKDPSAPYQAPAFDRSGYFSSGGNAGPPPPPLPGYQNKPALTPGEAAYFVANQPARMFRPLQKQDTAADRGDFGGYRFRPLDAAGPNGENASVPYAGVYDVAPMPEGRGAPWSAPTFNFRPRHNDALRFRDGADGVYESGGGGERFYPPLRAPVAEVRGETPDGYVSGGW